MTLTAHLPAVPGRFLMPSRLPGPFLIFTGLVWCEREHQPNDGSVRLSGTRRSTNQGPPPAVCQPICLHKLGYSHARAACRGVNSLTCWWKIGYQSQQVDPCVPRKTSELQQPRGAFKCFLKCHLIHHRQCHATLCAINTCTAGLAQYSIPTRQQGSA